MDLFRRLLTRRFTYSQRQLRLIKSSAWTPPEGIDGEPKDAWNHSARIRQKLAESLIGQGASLVITCYKAFGGWNSLWNIAVTAGQWYSRTVGSTRPWVSFLSAASNASSLRPPLRSSLQLVANPVFFLLDLSLNILVSSLVTNLYLAYSSPDIYPETANLSFFGRLKAHFRRSWTTSTRKMWFFKSFGNFVLPALTITPGMMIASQIQYKFENGMYQSLAKAFGHMAGAGL